MCCHCISLGILSDINHLHLFAYLTDELSRHNTVLKYHTWTRLHVSLLFLWDVVVRPRGKKILDSYLAEWALQNIRCGTLQIVEFDGQKTSILWQILNTSVLCGSLISEFFFKNVFKKKREKNPHSWRCASELHHLLFYNKMSKTLWTILKNGAFWVTDTLIPSLLHLFLVNGEVKKCRFCCANLWNTFMNKYFQLLTSEHNASCRENERSRNSHWS